MLACVCVCVCVCVHAYICVCMHLSSLLTRLCAFFNYYCYYYREEVETVYIILYLLVCMWRKLRWCTDDSVGTQGINATLIIMHLLCMGNFSGGIQVALDVHTGEVEVVCQHSLLCM